MSFRPKPPMGRGLPGPPQGHALHIGVNKVDPRSYGGWEGELAQCASDAQVMASLAQDAGFTTSVRLLGEAATSVALLGQLDRLAQLCRPGDLALVTFSGHGGQLPDLEHDEIDSRDETWVLYDRMVLDDEIRQAFTKFQADVRILVVADCCHSATSTDAIPGGFRRKEISRAAAQAQRDLNSEWFDVLRRANAYATPQAGVLLLSACRDQQTALEDDNGGLLTQKLVSVWDDGRFSGDYNALRDAIDQEVEAALSGTPLSQTPGLLSMIPGDPLTAFAGQKPFTLTPPQAVVSEPGVDGATIPVAGGQRLVTVTVQVPVD